MHSRAVIFMGVLVFLLASACDDTIKSSSESAGLSLVGCYSAIGEDGEEKVSLQVAQKGEYMYVGLGYKEVGSIINEQLLAHKMDRQELIKTGFDAEDIDKFSSNIFLNRRSDIFVGLVRVVPGKEVRSFERLAAQNFKKGSDYFAFLGIVGAWVSKVDCLEAPDKRIKKDAELN